MTKTESEPLDVSALRQQAEAEYRRLALDVAQGEHPSPEKLQRVLWAAGRTLDDLERHVGQLRARFDAAARLQEADAMAGELEDARAVEKRTADALAVVETEYRAALADAGQRLQQAQGHRRALESRRTELAASRRVLTETADAELDEELRRLRAVEAGLQRRIEPARRLRAEVEAARQRAERFAETKGPDFRPPWFSGPSPEDELREAEEKLRRNADVVAQADRAAVELKAVQAAMAEAERAKLRPEAMKW